MARLGFPMNTSDYAATENARTLRLILSIVAMVAQTVDTRFLVDTLKCVSRRTNPMEHSNKGVEKTLSIAKDHVPASLHDILITADLAHRPARPPNYEAESRALAVLAEAMADSPQTILQKLVETALDLCRAD